MELTESCWTNLVTQIWLHGATPITMTPITQVAFSCADHVHSWGWWQCGIQSPSYFRWFSWRISRILRSKIQCWIAGMPGQQECSQWKPVSPGLSFHPSLPVKFTSCGSQEPIISRDSRVRHEQGTISSAILQGFPWFPLHRETSTQLLGHETQWYDLPLRSLQPRHNDG